MLQKEQCKLVGERIKIQRLRRGITQEMLAEMVEITSVYLSKIERGKANAAGLIIWRIAKALDVDMNYIFKDC